VVATRQDEVERFADRIWKEREFGEGPHRVVVETYIPGHELSYMGLCDGKRFVPLASATDYKRVGTGDQGANTGGMGAISPSPFLTPALTEAIRAKITEPLTRHFEAERFFFRGVLYVGLMITPTGEPYVLEFNARFGDPETQAVLLRLESDFVDLLEATAQGKLDSCPSARWSGDTSLYVVGAAEGYPEKPKLGDGIEGLERVPPDLQIFFSGVSGSADRLSTAGGRVLGLGGRGKTPAEARQKVYDALAQVRWRGMHFRTDIGAKE
jgi:phosphoribosylamine--glycine ligase